MVWAFSSDFALSSLVTFFDTLMISMIRAGPTDGYSRKNLAWSAATKRKRPISVKIKLTATIQSGLDFSRLLGYSGFRVESSRWSR